VTTTPTDEIRLATADEHPVVAECVNAAYATYVPRIGKKPAPMLADYPDLIASGSVYVVDGLPGVQAVQLIELHDDPTIRNQEIRERA
jgi:hypothetical protein